MIDQPFKKKQIEWLVDAPESGNVDIPASGDYPWVDLPIPPAIGKGGSIRFELSLGITLDALRFDFQPEAVGKILPGVVVNVEFDEPTFQATTFRGVRLIYEEAHPLSRFGLSEGIDFFRFTDRYQTTVSTDCSFSGSAVIMSARFSSMELLIGREMTMRLIDATGMGAMPSIAARKIPLHASHHLATAITPNMKGMSLKLFAQAKVLQYLAALNDHLWGADGETLRLDERTKQRVRSLHEFLIACEGKLPALEDLAMQFGRSAKLLNEEFASEYGQPIYAFMADHRLMQAHVALQHTAITIKQLSARLGYAHVSNFTIAFKRKYGYPPGSLRRK